MEFIVRMIADTFMLFQKFKFYKFKRKTQESFNFSFKQQAMPIKLKIDKSVQWLVGFPSFFSIKNRVNSWVHILSIPHTLMLKSYCKSLDSYY